MADIETHRVIEWGRGITHLAQQMGSNLGMAVDVDMGFTGKRKTYDQLAEDDDPSEVTTRHMNTPVDDADYRRRNVIPKDYVRAIMVDEEDIQKILNDPRSAISESIAAGFGRKKDDIIIEAALATALTGEDGTGTAAFDTTNNQIVHGSAGMTVDKMTEAREILEGHEELEDESTHRWYMALNARARRNLLNTTEVTSQDFNTVRALVRGGISEFVGFEMVKSQRLDIDGSSIRSCLAWVKSGIKLAVQREAHSDIGQRRDKNMNWQVLYKASYGATRMRETAVVEIQTDES